MNWGSDVGMFQPLHTFDEAWAENGLRDDDWVFDILFLHLLNVGTSYIIQVRKFPTSEVRLGKEETTIIEKIRGAALAPSF